MDKYDKKTPYNELPLLPPKVEIETKKVLQKTISASRSLAKLNGAMTGLPNPGLFLDTLYLQEAKASSEIENIVTTNDELFKSAAADLKIENSATKEVLRYKEALWLGMLNLKKRPLITTNLFIEIVQCIKQNRSGIRTVPGTTLSTPNGEIIYTPPSGENVIRDKLHNLEKFINEENGIDPLIKMALIHYQFEAIHPFSDGNGRTGRILLLLYLKLQKLLDIPGIYLSGYIIKNKTDYYLKLRKVTEKNDWEGFILYMLDMIESTSKESIKQLDSIVNLMDMTSQKIKTALPKIYSKDLIEQLFRLPYTKRQFLIDAGLGNPKTVGKYLQSLENGGFLKSVAVGKEKLYLNYELMNILEKR